MAHADIDLNPRKTNPPYGNLAVRTTWVEKTAMEQVPGARYDGKTGGVWYLPLSWGSCVVLRAVLGDQLTLGEKLINWATEERRRRVDPAMQLRELIDVPTYDLFDNRLYPYQRVDAYWLMQATTPTLSADATTGRSGGALLGNDMGTGKTISTLEALRVMTKLGIPTLPMLMVTPNSVKQHWARRIPTWFPDATPYVIPNTGAMGRRKAALAARDDPSAVVIINIEAVALMSRLAPYGSTALKRCRTCDPRYGDESVTATRCEVHNKEFNGFGFKMAVVDEIHRIRNPQAKQTRAVWAAIHDPSIERRIGLTGTSIGQHVGDLWSVMHALAPDDYPVKSTWMDRIALYSWDSGGGLAVVGIHPERRDEFYRVLDPRFRRMPIELVLPHLPPVVRSERVVQLGQTQRRMYDELDRQLHTYTEDGEFFVTPSNLTKAVRLQQLAAASVSIEKPDPDDVTSWKVTLREPSPKLDALEEVLDELGDTPCAVAAEHLQLIDLAAKRLDKLKIPYGLITGPTSTFDRDQALENLNNGRIRVLLFTMATGAEGLDMSAVDTLVLLQLSWNMITNIQTERRNRRIGSEQHHTLRIISITVDGTCESTQSKRYGEKLERLEEINRDRVTLRRALKSTPDQVLGIDLEALDREETEIMNSFLGTP